jgi:hypothetical protein
MDLLKTYQAAIHERIWKSRRFPAGRKGEYILFGGYVIEQILNHCDEYYYCQLMLKDIGDAMGMTHYKLRKYLCILEDIEIIQFVSRGVAVVPLEQEQLKLKEDLFQTHLKTIEHRTVIL